MLYIDRPSQVRILAQGRPTVRLRGSDLTVILVGFTYYCIVKHVRAYSYMVLLCEAKFKKIKFFFHKKGNNVGELVNILNLVLKLFVSP